MNDSATSFTRTIDGRELPTPGSFALDPTHSSVEFSARHMMISRVRGQFTEVSGTLQVAEEPSQSVVEVEVDLASVDTRNEERDGHLRSADFFDVEQFPKMTFRGTGLTLTGGESFELHGNLSVHGVTQPITLQASFDGAVQDPWGNQRLGFSANGEVDRESFGLTWNQALETGGVLVASRAQIEVEAQFVRQPAD